MIRAIRIATDGSVEPLILADNLGTRIRTLQEAVGGYLEIIPHEFPNFTVFANEEAKLNPHEKNELATAIFGKSLLYGDYIAGPIVVTGGLDEKGDEQDLTTAQLDIFLNPNGNILNALAALHQPDEWEQLENNMKDSGTPSEVIGTSGTSGHLIRTSEPSHTSRGFPAPQNLPEKLAHQLERPLIVRLTDWERDV